MIAPAEAGNRRGFYLGYANAQEVFRYSDHESALAALLAAVDTLGRSQLIQSCVGLDVDAYELHGSGLLVYGPASQSWLARLTDAGAIRLGRPAMIEVSPTALVGWRLRVYEVPTTVDRRGVVHAPLARLAEAVRFGRFPIRSLIRAAPEQVTPAQVVSELVDLATPHQRARAFQSVARIVRTTVASPSDAQLGDGSTNVWARK